MGLHVKILADVRELCGWNLKVESLRRTRNRSPYKILVGIAFAWEETVMIGHTV